MFDENLWEEFLKMHHETDETLGRLFGNKFAHGKELAHPQNYRMPLCQMQQTPNSVVLRFELPGVEKNHIHLNVTANSIEIKVDKKQEHEVKKKGAYSYSSSQSQFYRKISLPFDVKADKAEAEYTNGVLKVEIPKLKIIESKPKRIAIK
jgi:HSP20 family protein